MDPDPSIPKEYDPEHLAKLAEETGSDFECSYPADGAPGSSDNKAVLSGTITIREFSHGIKMSKSVVHALRTYSNSAVLEKSFNLAFCIAGDRVGFKIGNKKDFSVSYETGAVMSVAESIRFSSTYLKGQGGSYISFHIAPENIADKPIAEKINALLNKTEVRLFTVSQHTRQLVARLADIPLTDAVSLIYAESCMLELLADAVDLFSDGDENWMRVSLKDAEKLKKVQDILKADPSGEHTLSSLSHEVGMSVSVLKRKFPLVTDMTVSEYLRKERMNLAYIGLSKNDWSVAEAARLTGFRYQSNFATAFRRHFGVSPNKLRKANTPQTM